jgi:chromosome segregation ATPase
MVKIIDGLSNVLLMVSFSKTLMPVFLNVTYILGYGVSTDLIEYMEDYSNLLKGLIRQLNTYSNKWRSKLHSRSSLSSYNTTKLAQIQTVSSPDTLAQLIQTRCDAIQQVINSYKRQVDRMYPKERLGFVHKHYRSDNMEELFKDAYSDRQKVFEKLQKLQNDEKEAQEAVREAKAKCQNLELNETSSKSELSKVHDRLEKKEGKLQAIQTRITRTEDEYRQAQETYRRKATGIYQQCRELEEERLNQIRETLIAFNRAIHSTEYSNKQNDIYENLLATIESGQKTLVDLDFWKRTYRVESMPLENNESQPITTVENAFTLDVNDDEDERTD